MEPTVEKKARNDRVMVLSDGGMSQNEIARQLAAEGFDVISGQRVAQIIAARRDPDKWRETTEAARRRWRANKKG